MITLPFERTDTSIVTPSYSPTNFQWPFSTVAWVWWLRIASRATDSTAAMIFARSQPAGNRVLPGSVLSGPCSSMILLLMLPPMRSRSSGGSGIAGSGSGGLVTTPSPPASGYAVVIRPSGSTGTDTVTPSRSPWATQLSRLGFQVTLSG